MRQKVLGFGLGSIALAALLANGACGGSGATGSGGGATLNPAATSPTFITAGDAPMSSVIAALVTISAVTFTDSTGATVQLLSQPRKIELTHLGGIRAPLDLKQLPLATYNNLALTVSAAQITYIDPTTNQPVTTNATIPAAKATASIALTPALAVTDSGATDIRFDFDLQDSLDLTSGAVTFTPTLSAAAARVSGETNPNRILYIEGMVSAVSTTANTITLVTDDSALSVTLNVNSNTTFDSNLSLTNIQGGDFLKTQDALNTDGTLTALLVQDDSGGGAVTANNRIDSGVVTSVTRDSGNNLSAFSIVVRDGSSLANLGLKLSVNMGSGSTFKLSTAATQAGLALWDQTQIYPGQAVWVNGSVQSAGVVVATTIKPAQVYPFGLTSAAVQTVSGGNSVAMLIDTVTGFAKFAGISTVTTVTNANTAFDGSSLTAANFASVGVGTPLTVAGFLAITGTGVNTTATVYASHVHQENPRQ